MGVCVLVGIHSRERAGDVRREFECVCKSDGRGLHHSVHCFLIKFEFYCLDIQTLTLM